MRRKTSILLALALLLVGLGVLSYPTLSDYVNRINGSFAIRALNDTLARAEPETIAAQRRLAEEYNAALGTGEGTGYDAILDFGNGIMGRIQIPKIGVDLPIYHGTSSLVLEKGVGHMPGTAFPIGGSGSHAVLTGHTGLPTAELFTDLTKLEVGDRFCIHILREILVYRVDQIRVVLPAEAEALSAVPGEDHCTLVTCTPYGINSHRLLVRGIREAVAAEEASQVLQAGEERVSVPPVLLAAAAAAVGILAAMAAVILKKEEKQ